MSRPLVVPIKDDWLARHVEEPVRPDMRIVDCHHHCLAYPDYLYYEEALLADIAASGHTIAATVHAETGGRGRGCSREAADVLRPVGETEALVAAALALPPGAPKISLGIVGFADLELGAAVGETLDAHVAAGQGRFKGIRQITPWDADEEMTPAVMQLRPHRLIGAAFREGFAELAPRGLSFDSWIYGPQIPELADLADTFPDTTIVIDHAGTPLMQNGYAEDRPASFRGWARAMRDLAQRPNVHCKIGGLAKWLTGLNFDDRPEPPTSNDLASAWQPYVDVCIEAFGPARCMFESNFPQEKPSCSYGIFWNACKRMAAGLSEDEQAALFSGTASRVYRLVLD